MPCYLLAIGGDTPFARLKDPMYSVTNHTTHAPATDGSTVFLLGQCQSGCRPGTPVDITLDMTGLNTTFTVALTDQTWSMAILACIPNITIETREVRNDGHGLLSVQPLPAGHQLTRQGNLNPIQTTALFSIATMSLAESAGALSGTRIQYYSLGSQVQGDVLFGKALFEGLPGTDAPYGTTATISPAPIENITQGYTQILQSVSKCPLLDLVLLLVYLVEFLRRLPLSVPRGLPRHRIRPRTHLQLRDHLCYVHPERGRGDCSLRTPDRADQPCTLQAGQGRRVHAHQCCRSCTWIRASRTVRSD